MGIPKGVSPTFTFTFSDENLDLTQAAHVYVTFKNGATITKSDADLTIAARQIDVYLTQAETLAFRQGATQIQVNWTYGDGSRAASEVVSFSFSNNLLDEVLQ